MAFLQFCPKSGLLVVGHANGEVRMYQFSPLAYEVSTYEATSRSHKKLRAEEESGRHAFPAALITKQNNRSSLPSTIA